LAVATAFWVDDEFDRQHGPGGNGRYGAAVRERRDDFADVWGDISPVGFAVTAWALAVGLEPGFVRCHRRIISATCRRSSWDGGLTCAVTIVAPWPAELTRARQWTRDRGWRNWPQLFGQYVIPTERDLARVPHLRAQLTVEAPIPIDDLPCTPEHRDDRVEHAARHAVVVIVRELNELLGPMLTQLDSDAPTGR